MFERYTEKARRVIFFARYEASQFLSPYIETEHLLLGVLREDKALANRFLRSAATVESIRRQIEQHGSKPAEVTTSVDLPLSHESKRVLAYGAEESARMKHQHIGTPHLLLGLLREEKCVAAGLLRERGLRLAQVREEVARENGESKESGVSGGQPPQVLVDFLLACEQRGGITVAARATVGKHAPDFAIYSGDGVETDGDILKGGPLPTPPTAAGEVADIKQQIKLIIRRMENAIGRHDFTEARACSEQEREMRRLLREKRAQYKLEETLGDRLPTPFLCIEIIREESLPEMHRRFDDYLSAGVSGVWVLNFSEKRVYTVTNAEGLREFKGTLLRMAGLELNLTALFA